MPVHKAMRPELAAYALARPSLFPDAIRDPRAFFAFHLVAGRIVRQRIAPPLIRTAFPEFLPAHILRCRAMLPFQLYVQRNVEILAESIRRICRARLSPVVPQPPIGSNPSDAQARRRTCALGQLPILQVASRLVVALPMRAEFPMPYMGDARLPDCLRRIFLRHARYPTRRTPVSSCRRCRIEQTEPRSRPA